MNEKEKKKARTIRTFEVEISKDNASKSFIINKRKDC